MYIFEETEEALDASMDKMHTCSTTNALTTPRVEVCSSAFTQRNNANLLPISQAMVGPISLSRVE